MTKRIVALLVVCVATPVFADGKLTGRVSDSTDQPLRDVSVIVSGPRGVETTVVTDPTGHYVAKLPAGTHTVMFAFGNKRVTQRVDVVDGTTAKLDGTLEIGGEIIDVYDAPRPAKFAKPKSDPLAIPQYSDRAVLTDAWAKAWLLLDVDDRGVVSRVRFLKRPGYDLDEIAVRHAFGLRFDPARNEHGLPVKSYIVWPIEWPSQGWMQELELPMNRLPNFFASKQFPAGSRFSVAFSSYPPCSGGPWRFADIDGAGGNHATRDCSVPDLSKADASEPWIERDASMPPPSVAEAPAPIDPRKELRDDIASAKRNRTAAWVATGGALALVAGTLVAWEHYGTWSDRVDADLQQRSTLLPPGQLESDQRHAHNWMLGTFSMATGAMLAGIASGYFWAHASTSVTLSPNGEGAMLGVSSRF